MTRPNLLVIMSDQHNPHVLGCAGDPHVRTPSLDRMAAGGVCFDNTYCAGPLCVPSRMSFVTGLFPHDLEIWTNHGVLPSNVPTFAHALSLADCQTTLCGRMHFNGPDQNHGFERRLAGDVSGAAEAGPKGLFEGVWNRTGCGQTYRSLLPDAVGTGQASYAAYDAMVTERARQFLREEVEAPFCLVVGFLLPHNPYVCPQDLFEEYMDKLPQLSVELPADEHPAVQALRATRGTGDITPEMTRRARAAYYGLATLMDRNIGRVLDALDEAGLADSTAVVYTTDHGEMAGEHGLWWKDSFYEGSVRVPMIWSWPGRFREGHRVDAVTSLLDIAPTLLELGGAEPLPGQRGHSLTGFLDAERQPGSWPDTAYAETCAHGQRPARMLRTGRWKLNVYHGHHAPQLFDLQADPGEATDLGSDEALRGVREELTARACDGWSGADVERREALNRQRADLTKRWRSDRGVRDSELWHMPAGCNHRDDG